MHSIYNSQFFHIDQEYLIYLQPMYQYLQHCMSQIEEPMIYEQMPMPYLCYLYL